MLITAAFLSIILLFILSAFWAVAETALTSLSKYRIRKIITLNKELAETLKQWLKSPYYILTTIMVGDTLTSFILSSLATLMVFMIIAPVNRDLSELTTWLVITFLSLVFGEITPKIFGRINPEKVTLVTVPILSRLVAVIRPFMAPFVRLAKLVSPRVTFMPFSRLTSLTLEEIRGLITEADTRGVLGKETRQMLQRVLRLSEMNVSQIMTHADRIEAVNIDQDVEKFLDMVVETGRSRVPVYHSTIHRIAGFVHTKDLLMLWRKSPGSFSTDLIRPPYFVAPDKKIQDLLHDFQSGQTHLAFVVDAFGNFLGLVTLEDVLEEIVGEILDEYDVKQREKHS